MTYRDYQPADFRRLCEIDRRCFPRGIAYTVTEMAAILRRHGRLAMVAENVRGVVVGFVAAHVLGQGRGHLVTLDVLRGYRRQGIGRELLTRCEERLGAAGVRRIRLETAASNRAAHVLYISLGYTFVRMLPRYYPSGEDAWLMEKALEPSDVRP
ncbi:MAG: GNAT family N-acetyltransferase [Acidobacteria bacterium]|nr:GNAT family N-acetyltransferase [Acidobacteriota bacterium]